MKKKTRRIYSRGVGEKVAKKQKVTRSLRKGEIREIHLRYRREE